MLSPFRYKNSVENKFIIYDLSPKVRIKKLCFNQGSGVGGQGSETLFYNEVKSKYYKTQILHENKIK